jgi:hypothetical protein
MKKAKIEEDIAAFYKVFDDINSERLLQQIVEAGEYVRARREIEMFKWCMAEAEEALYEQNSFSFKVKKLFRRAKEDRLARNVERLRKEAEAFLQRLHEKVKREEAIITLAEFLRDEREG